MKQPLNLAWRCFLYGLGLLLWLGPVGCSNQPGEQGQQQANSEEPSLPMPPPEHLALWQDTLAHYQRQNDTLSAGIDSLNRLIGQRLSPDQQLGLMEEKVALETFEAILDAHEKLRSEHSLLVNQLRAKVLDAESLMHQAVSREKVDGERFVRFWLELSAQIKRSLAELEAARQAYTGWWGRVNVWLDSLEGAAPAPGPPQ